MLDKFAELKASISMRDIVSGSGYLINNNGFICCPFHNEKTPSCKIYEDKFHCYSCGESGDIFDFVAKINNCDNKESFNIISQKFNINATSNKPTTANKTKAEVNQSEFIKACAKNIEKTTYHRGISLETLKRFNIGFCEKWRANENAPYSPRLIIPTSDYSYLARDTRENLSEAESKFSKQKVGAVRMFDAIRDANKPVFIVEGEIDALSIADAGGNALGLGSVSNQRKLVKWLEMNKPTIPLILALDNDKAGLSGTKALEKDLSEKGYKFITCNIYGDCKDANEALNKDKSKLKASILKAEQEATKIAEKEQKKNSGVICLSDIEAQEVEWLWKPYIPKGKITLLSADPGTGKTFFCLYLASVVSKGGTFFNEKNSNRLPATVIYQTAEDGLSDTIVPRLKPMKPNLSNIFVIDESKKQLKFNDKVIDETMALYKPDLMIFDPLQAYLGENVDMHRANEVRPVLSRIEKLAEKHNCAVILIMHLSKQSQSSALYRGLGSMDIPAIARSMLVMGKHPEDDNKRVICHEKSSLYKNGNSMVFSIDMLSSGLVYEGECDYSANDILNAHSKTRNKPKITLEQATDELNNLVGEKGFCSLSDAQKLREKVGFSATTLHNARDTLGLKTVQFGYGKNKKSFWYAPEDYETKTEEEIKNHIKEITEEC